MFEVALALHNPNPREMLKEMDKDTFMYWVAFLSMKKREHSKQDYQQALLTKIVAEMFSSGSGKSIDKYLIKFQTDEERLEEQFAENDKFMNSLPVFANTKVETTYWDGKE